MYLALSNSLGSSSRGQDPSAADYIAAVRAAGATVTSSQVGEINTFYKAAKSGGYYTSLKRLYLPIWGVAAANAIDMIGLTSGTFSGGVTHGAGFVQGNGTTGYFDSATSPTDISLDMTGATMFRLIYEAITGNNYIGAISGADGFWLGSNGTNCVAIIGAVAGISVANDERGILLTSRTSTTAFSLYARNSSGFTTVGSDPTLDTGGLPNRDILLSGARDNGVVAAIWADTSKDGLYGIANGMNAATAQTFTSHLKTLWEGCTGLTLP